jgi:hypothetical protein
MKNPDLEKMVHQALDNALENGFAEMFLTDSPWTIAIDLTTYDADLEGCDPAALEPYVQTFLKSNKEKLEGHAG